MNHGNALAFALSATVALLLASRAFCSMRLSSTTAIGMALAWAVLIVSAAGIAALWHG